MPNNKHIMYAVLDATASAEDHFKLPARRKRSPLKLILLCLVVLGLVAFAYSATASVSMTMINVSGDHTHGDSYLIEDNGVVSMFDSAQYRMAVSAVVPTLTAKRIKTIDHLWLSHEHFDHYEGIRAFKEAGIKLKNFYYSSLPCDATDHAHQPEYFAWHLSMLRAMGTKIHDVKEGFRFSTGEAHFRLVHSHNEEFIDGRRVSLNDLSLVVQVSVGTARLLLTGDLDYKVGSSLVGNKKIEADIVHMAHHGATGHPPVSFYDTTKAKVALFSISKLMSWNSRSDLSFQWAEENTSQHCSSAVNDTVVVEFFDETYRIKPRHASNKCGYTPFRGSFKPVKWPVNMGPILQLLLSD